MSDVDEKIIVRLRLLTVATLGLGMVLLVRLWFLQVVNGAEYVALAEQNRVRQVAVGAPRGLILDRNRTPMVKNRLSLNLTILPAFAKDNKLIRKVARVAGMSVEAVRLQLKSTKADPLEPRVVKRDLDMRTVAYVEEHQSELRGVEIRVDSARQYPGGSMAAHILGYTGEISDTELGPKKAQGYALGDVVGQAGVEKVYEDALRGSKGVENVEVNAEGRPIRVLSRKEAVPGNDLILTIDRRIQRVTEEALLEALERAKKQKYPKATAGAVVVMNPNNGEIVAMASYPTYDPSVFVGGVSSPAWQTLNNPASEYPLNNRAVMSAYPPGSTFKVVTASAGLATGTMTPSTIYVCRGMWYGLGGKWKKGCWLRTGHGSVNLMRALTVSCDIYFYEVAAALHWRGSEELQQWARKYGLGEPSGVDLPSETAGRVPDKKWKADFNKSWPENRDWFPGDTVNMGIGQGDILVSPLQLARLYAAIANGGKLYRPHVVKSVVSTSKEGTYDIPIGKAEEVGIGAENLEAIRNGLKQVVKTGTAAGAFAGFPMDVAGKTGTSEMFGKDDFAFFAAYGPADNPEYVVAMVIEQGGHGGAAAAPSVRRIFSEIYGLDSLSKGSASDASR